MINLKKLTPIGQVFFESGLQVCGEYADRLMDSTTGHKVNFYFDTATGLLYAHKEGKALEILAAHTWKRIITKKQLEKSEIETAYQETKRLRKELAPQGEKTVSPLAKAKEKIKIKKQELAKK